MAVGTVPTLLSLDRWAWIMQVNPAHFNGAAGATYFPMVDNASSDIWFQYAWLFADAVSRDELSRAIQRTETDIMAVIGYPMRPIWVYEELTHFPRHYRPDVWRWGKKDARNNEVAVQTNHGKVISPGRRALSDPITTDLTLMYSDEDGDGFDETATITVTTTLTDVCELHVYFAGHDGDPEWEIRPARSKAISGGTATFTFWCWQMIDQSEFTPVPTTAGPAALNIEDATIFVTSSEIEVRREYNDTTAVTAEFFWEPTPWDMTSGSWPCTNCGGAGCEACQLITQNGCLHIRDAVNGWVVAMPATYDAADQEWDYACLSVCRDPDQVKMWYYAGDISQKRLSGLNCELMDDRMEEAIAYMATARLEREFCSGANTTGLARKLRTDMAVNSGGVSFQVSPQDLDNPFGSRYGEILAWRYVQHLEDHHIQGVAV